MMDELDKPQKQIKNKDMSFRESNSLWPCTDLKGGWGIWIRSFPIPGIREITKLTYSSSVRKKNMRDIKGKPGNNLLVPKNNEILFKIVQQSIKP